MKYRFAVTALAIFAAWMPLAGQAQTEVHMWHSMVAVNGERVNDLAKDFNTSQKDFRVVPVFKGSYDKSMTAAIAAFRAGNAPHILQVLEVGTATMMASKGAIVPVAKAADILELGKFLERKLRVQTRLETQKLHRKLGITSLFVTHDQVEAMTLAQRMMVMNAGRMEQFGTPQQVYNRPASIFVANFMGSTLHVTPKAERLHWSDASTTQRIA